MSITMNANFYNNLMSSVEAFLNTNVVAPYNAAVTGTNIATPIKCVLRPQDEGTVVYVPAIVLPDVIYDYKDSNGTGMGDGAVWLYKRFDIEVYPALSTDTNGAQKSSMKSAFLLHSLFDNVSTALTIPFMDYTTNPASPTALGGMFMCGREKRLHGAITSLALHRNRFDYELDVHFDALTLNG